MGDWVLVKDNNYATMPDTAAGTALDALDGLHDADNDYYVSGGKLLRHGSGANYDVRFWPGGANGRIKIEITTAAMPASNDAAGIEYQITRVLGVANFDTASGQMLTGGYQGYNERKQAVTLFANRGAAAPSTAVTVPDPAGSPLSVVYQVESFSGSGYITSATVGAVSTTDTTPLTYSLTGKPGVIITGKYAAAGGVPGITRLKFYHWQETTPPTYTAFSNVTAIVPLNVSGSTGSTINVTGPSYTPGTAAVTTQWYYQVGLGNGARTPIAAADGGTGANLVWAVPSALQNQTLVITCSLTDGTITISEIGAVPGQATQAGTGAIYRVPSPAVPTFAPGTNLWNTSNSFITIGDSLTEAHFSVTLPTLLASINVGASPMVKNVAHSGTTIANWSAGAAATGAGQSEYDTTLNNYEGARKAIRDAIAAGKTPKAVFIGLGTNGFGTISSDLPTYQALISMVRSEVGTNVPIFCWGLTVYLSAYTTNQASFDAANSLLASALPNASNKVYFNPLTDLQTWFFDHQEATDRSVHPLSGAGDTAQAAFIFKPAYDYFAAPALTSIIITRNGDVLTAAPVPAEASLGTVNWATNLGSVSPSVGNSTTLTEPAPTSADQAATITATSGSASGTATFPVAAASGGGGGGGGTTGGGITLTNEQAQTLAYLAQMIEPNAGAPRFSAVALSILGITDGADVPDITITGVSLNKNNFYRSAREMLVFTVQAVGGDAPLQFAHMNYYIGFTDENATEPPPVSECLPIQPRGGGSGTILLRLLLGTEDGSETMPILQLPAGRKKAWTWACGQEKLPNPAGIVTMI